MSLVIRRSNLLPTAASIRLMHYLTWFALFVALGCGQDVSPPLTNTTRATIAEAEPNDLEPTPMSEQWPFTDADNTAVITLDRIMNSSQPILYVVHSEPGDWQFLDGGDVTEADAAVVSLKNIADHDPSVKSLADLPSGWAAKRTTVGQAWQRFQQ